MADDLTIGGGIQIGSNYIDFEVGSTVVYTPAPGYGTFQVTSVGSGSVFASAGVTASELGQIQSLNEPPGTVVLPAPFITFLGVGGATTPLTATSIPAGSVGPFTLTDTPHGAEAVFEVLGYVGANTAETFTAEFNMYFPGVTVAELFTNLPRDTTYCANIDVGGTPTLCNAVPQTGVPEPGTLALLGFSLAGTFAAYRISRRQARP